MIYTMSVGPCTLFVPSDHSTWPSGAIPGPVHMFDLYPLVEVSQVQVLHDLTLFGVFLGLFNFWFMEYMSDHLGIKRNIVRTTQKSIQNIFP